MTPSANRLDPWLEARLCCPRHHTPLRVSSRHGTADAANGDLECPEGDTFPIVDGIPVLLLPEAEQTQTTATATLRAVEEYRAGRAESPLPAPSRAAIAGWNGEGIHPHVQRIVSDTCGILYKGMVGALSRYPIPELRLPEGRGKTFLDVGCHWGRWCVAAARKGYLPVGIDPTIEGIAAARIVAAQLGVRALYVVADGRFLPFADGTFDVAFSYSVLQHFAKTNAKAAIDEMARVTSPGGTVKIQLPNAFGIRSLYHQVRRRFREARDFEVRYWTLPELQREFTQRVGRSDVTVDGYFGLGIQPADLDLMPAKYRAVIRTSELLRGMSRRLPPLRYVADSLYVTSRREP